MFNALRLMWMMFSWEDDSKCHGSTDLLVLYEVLLDSCRGWYEKDDSRYQKLCIWPIHSTWRRPQHRLIFQEIRMMKYEILLVASIVQKIINTVLLSDGLSTWHHKLYVCCMVGHLEMLTHRSTCLLIEVVIHSSWRFACYAFLHFA